MIAKIKRPVAKIAKKPDIPDTPLVRQKAMEAVNKFNQECFWITHLDTKDSRATYRRIFEKDPPVCSLRTFLANTYHELYGCAPDILINDADLKTIIGYELQHRGIQEHGLPTFFNRYKNSFYKNYEASKLLITNRKEAIEKFNPVMKCIVKAREEIQNEKEIKMATAKNAIVKKEKKEKKNRRVVVIELLNQKKYTDEQIASMATKEIGNDTTAQMVSFIRNAYNKGKFPLYGKPSSAIEKIGGEKKATVEKKPTTKKAIAKKPVAKKPIKKVIKKK